MGLSESPVRADSDSYFFGEQIGSFVDPSAEFGLFYLVLMA